MSKAETQKRARCAVVDGHHAKCGYHADGGKPRNPCAESADLGGPALKDGEPCSCHPGGFHYRDLTVPSGPARFECWTCGAKGEPGQHPMSARLATCSALNHDVRPAEVRR